LGRSRASALNHFRIVSGWPAPHHDIVEQRFKQQTKRDAANEAAFGPRDSQQQNLRFQGQYFDEETGLHYNRFRYYDPDVGRFVNQDPIGLAGGNNLFRYAPNPIAWIDPFGLNTASDAEKLAANMEACGSSRPNSRYRAHHIVMSNSTDPLMDAVRKKMQGFGIDINDAANGIWLPETVGDRRSGDTMTAHKGEGVHEKAYKKHVHDTLNGATDEADFRKKLAQLNDGKRPV
jgi:RHS repeat-associated protein